MKCHISATIEKSLLEELDRFGREEKRSRSQSLEFAIEEFLKKKKREHSLVTSSAVFSGKVSREETYGDR